MASSLADLLCRRASTVIDVGARIQLFRSIVAELNASELDLVTLTLVERAGMRDPKAQVALLALQIVRATTAPGAESLSRPTPPKEPVEPDEPQEPRELGQPAALEDLRRVPDYGRGRTLTLGERKSLARKPDRKLIDRVLRDPHPDVIELALNNPRLTEDDVVRLCARRPNVPEVLLRVFSCPRWSARARVRSALAMNPSTDPLVAEAVAPLLDPSTLRDMASDEHLPARVRLRCLEVLSRLPPTPPPPSDQLH